MRVAAYQQDQVQQELQQLLFQRVPCPCPQTSKRTLQLSWLSGLRTSYGESGSERVVNNTQTSEEHGL
jgi:hypothetical protein